MGKCEVIFAQEQELFNFQNAMEPPVQTAGGTDQVVLNLHFFVSFPGKKQSKGCMLNSPQQNFTKMHLFLHN